MTKKELQEKTKFLKSETKSALELLYNGLNQGQQKKLLKNSEVKRLLERYKVISGD